MNGWVVLLWSFVAALVLIVVGIFAALVVMGRITPFPTAEPIVTPTPEVTGVVDTEYSVMILNASGEEGLDVQLRDEVINAGWSADIVFAGDSASEDFETTTVYYIAEDDELAALGLADVIGGADVQQSDFYEGLNDTDQQQLTIVIGVDRLESAPEETEPEE
jgi:hypothetical protein